MVIIAHQNSYFAFAFWEHLLQRSNCDGAGIVCRRVEILGQQPDFAVVIEKTDPDQPLVCGSDAQLHVLEISQVDALIGEALVKFDHQRLIFCANRADVHLLTILHYPRGYILHWVWPDCGPWQLVIRHLSAMQFAVTGGRDHLPPMDDERINLKFLDPALFYNQLAEAYDQRLQ